MPRPPPTSGSPASLAGWVQRRWRDAVLTTDAGKRRALAGATLVIIGVIGVVDFLTGFNVSVFVFYCLPVVLGTAAQGRRFGLLTAALCVTTQVVSDFASGAHFASLAVPVWNAGIALGTFVVIVWLFATVLSLQQEMQERVRQRTAALAAEIAERERLERSLLDVSERERSAIGRELHDDLGQHLTGTAFAGRVLEEKLQARQIPEDSDARKVVALIEEGIEKTRRLARGLVLPDIPREGLVASLRGLAAEASSQFQIDCEFRPEGQLPPVGGQASLHLLRIAQEALSNAVRHGRARRIVITLAGGPDRLELSVRDHGRGLPAAADRRPGLGLHIMAHRARVLGGEFSVEKAPGGGTVVVCRLRPNLVSHDT